MQNRSAALFLAIFAIPFTAGGAWLLWMAIHAWSRQQDHWAMLGVSSVFLLFGIGLCVGAAAMARSQDAVSGPEPWRGRADWAAGKSRSDLGALTVLYMWAFCFVWGLASAAVVWKMIFHPDKDQEILFVGVFAIGFPLAGVSLLWVTLAQTWRLLRFGRSWLTFDAVPIPPGGVVSGRIDCAVDPRSDPTFSLELACSRTTVTRTGNSSSKITLVIWHADYQCAAETSEDVSNGSLVPVRFDLPADARPTGEDGPDRSIAWAITARAHQRGGNFAQTFAVPVFALPAGQEHAVSPERPAPRPVEQPVHGRVELEEADGALRISFPPSMNPGLATLPTALLIVFAWMCQAYAHQQSWFRACLAGAAAAIMLSAAARAWLMRTTLLVSAGELVVVRSILGLRWSRTYAGPDVALRIADGGNVGGQPLTKLKLSVGGKSIGVGSLLRSISEAKHIQDAVHARLNRA